MRGEYWIGGVLFPPLLLAAALAWIATALLRRVMAKFGFYRRVWHPALFDLALFIILLGGLEALLV